MFNFKQKLVNINLVYFIFLSMLIFKLYIALTASFVLVNSIFKKEFINDRVETQLHKNDKLMYSDNCSIQENLRLQHNQY